MELFRMSKYWDACWELGAMQSGRFLGKVTPYNCNCKSIQNYLASCFPASFSTTTVLSIRAQATWTNFGKHNILGSDLR